MEHRPYPAEPMRAGTVVARSVSTYIRNFGYFAVFTLLFGILALANFIMLLYAATIDEINCLSSSAGTPDPLTAARSSAG